MIERDRSLAEGVVLSGLGAQPSLRWTDAHASLRIAPAPAPRRARGPKFVGHAASLLLHGASRVPPRKGATLRE